MNQMGLGITIPCHFHYKLELRLIKIELKVSGCQSQKCSFIGMGIQLPLLFCE